jgi:hypothetical protein
MGRMDGNIRKTGKPVNRALLHNLRNFAAPESWGGVAQVSNLPYRRLPVGWMLNRKASLPACHTAPAGWETCDTADWKSALQDVHAELDADLAAPSAKKFLLACPALFSYGLPPDLRREAGVFRPGRYCIL